MSRLVPRFSLLNLLLIMALVGATIALWQTHSELADLRREVAQRRAEMGHVFVSDRTKLHAIGVDWNNEGNWKWRLFVPARSKLTLFTFVGDAPAIPNDNISKWLRGLETGDIGQGRRTQSGLKSGEFTLNLQFESEDGRWYFWTEGPQWKDAIPQEFDRWMSMPDRWYPSSRVSFKKQNIFDAGEPVMLLCVQESDEHRMNGLAGDTIVLWIDVDR